MQLNTISVPAVQEVTGRPRRHVGRLRWRPVDGAGLGEAPGTRRCNSSSRAVKRNPTHPSPRQEDYGTVPVFVHGAREGAARNAAIRCHRARDGHTARHTTVGSSARRAKVQRAPHSKTALVQHMRVQHRRRDVAVPQQLLHRPDVGSALQQVRRKGVPEGVAANPLPNKYRRLELPGSPRAAARSGARAACGAGGLDHARTRASTETASTRTSSAPRAVTFD